MAGKLRCRTDRSVRGFEARNDIINLFHLKGNLLRWNRLQENARRFFNKIAYICYRHIKQTYMVTSNTFDVIIIGGNYAGLAAAMALGRSLRKVLIIDSGKPCNQQTPHSHNFLTQDGETPAAITAKAKAQVLKYPTVLFKTDVAVTCNKVDSVFFVETEKGDEYTAKKLIFATGIKDIMLTIKGFKECWGISAVHCPYCHGYEFKDQKTGIMANGEKAYHLATLVWNLSKQVTLFTNGKADFTDEQLTKLNYQNIIIIEEKIKEVVHHEGYIKHVVLEDGSQTALVALYAALPFEQQCNLPVALGCELIEEGYIKIDDIHRTTVPGVFACGDNTNKMRSVSFAVATGSLTGSVINKDLIDEAF